MVVVCVTHGSCALAGSNADFCNEVVFCVDAFFSRKVTPNMSGKLSLSSVVDSFLTEDM